MSKEVNSDPLAAEPCCFKCAARMWDNKVDINYLKKFKAHTKQYIWICDVCEEKFYKRMFNCDEDLENE